MTFIILILTEPVFKRHKRLKNFDLKYFVSKSQRFKLQIILVLPATANLYSIIL
jgi:hypothetical protein